MNRRAIVTALACVAAGRLLARQDEARPRHKISAATLYEALASRFPMRLAFADLLRLQVSAPRLLLLPARNRLGAALVAELGGLQLHAAQAGEMDLVFALRYEAADQTVRAHRPEVLAVRWPGLPPEGLQAVQGLLPAVARQVGEFVVHRFSPRELALADTMGFEPREFTVVDDGLVIHFGPKPRP